MKSKLRFAFTTVVVLSFYLEGYTTLSKVQIACAQATSLPPDSLIWRNDTTGNKVMMVAEDAAGYVYIIKRFKNGQLHGLSEFFSSNGEVTERLRFKHGVLKATYRYRDGEIVEIEYPNGKVKRFKGCGC